MKVAIYARYSTDLQDKTSIDGQVANCAAVAAEHGLQVVAHFHDAAMSGTDDFRIGYRALLDAAERKEFDGIIVDETSRLTRNPWELPRVLEELAFRGQFLLAKGFDSRQETAHLLAGIYGGLDRMELQKIKARTHRGLRERHKAGYSAGGKTYGYSSEAIDLTDPDTKWRKVIDAESSPWVVWIFEQYASGIGAKTIAAELNRLGVPSPGSAWKNRTQRRTDGKWQHSAILGMASRGSGILRNELYIGRVIWNRAEWIKRPGTSTRTYRMRPEKDWIVEDHPELRIVPDELWRAVQSRLARTQSGGSKGGRKGTYLLTGLLKCADCGGSLTMIDQRCYGCGTRNRGGDHACDNPIRIRRTHLEERFLREVQDKLLHADVTRWAEKEIARRLAAPRADTSKAQKELVKVGQELANVADAIARVGLSKTLEEKLATLEHRKARLVTEIEAAEVVIDAPDLSAIRAKWRDVVGNLGSLSKRATATEVRAARSDLQAVLGIVKVDRLGKGYADLSIGVPARMVAGGRCGRFTPMVKVRVAC